MSAADHLGPQFHATPFPEDFPHREWVHFGTRHAAIERAVYPAHPANVNAEQHPPNWHVVEAHITGKVYPKILGDEEANNLVHADLPAHMQGYQAFPYKNEYEDPGSTSYLVHHRAFTVRGRRPLEDS